MDTPRSEQGSSLETMMKRGALVCVVAKARKSAAAKKARAAR